MRRAFEVICIALVIQGLSWVVFTSFDPLGIWDGMAASALYGAARLPADSEAIADLLTVILGATDAGFFVLCYALVRFGFGHERWAYWAVLAGVATWWLTDCIASVLLGASFNLWVVNMPAAALLGLPLWWLRPSGPAWPTCGRPRD